MKFSRAVAIAISAMPLLAAANSTRSGSKCSTGPIQCCNSTEKAGSLAGAALLGLLDIAVQDVDVLIGVECSPITAIGVGQGGSCSSQAVCCEDNSHGGLVSIGCVPVTL